MKEYEAINLLEKTFSNNFDLNNFTSFLKELLKNKFNIQNKSPSVASEFEDYIKSFKKIGEYRTKNKDFEILVVELKKADSLERARTMQRNFVAKWLNNSNFPKDGALVAFYGENPEDWRFSFVKMDYKLAQDGKVSKELTPAKRHSFLVGKNEPNHTCKRQFLNLLLEEEIPPTTEDLEKAFSVENVTKIFFDKYKELFIKLTDSLENIKDTNLAVKKEFDSKNISIEEFGKKLLGQIVFLYFLQKKGWLGVKKDENGEFNEWGTGHKDFMKRLFKGEIVKYKNFFNDVLEPLFYEALNTPRDNNYYSRFECKIPFLNGGLFEPINNYRWTETNILIDNNIFSEIFKTFDEFNFTIKEDEPLEREVAIDPEMLGKVFENLLEVKDRKSKGAFYTPREIVHYMCQQSLINYLETNTEISKEDLEKFVQKGDLALDYLRRAHEGKYVNSDFLLPPSIYKNVEKLNNLLKEIKICDPAVGSGAFPVGMMNEIIKARQILGYFLTEKQKSDYDLKRETIENCLYGVDLMPSAVDICKLRFWLSLIVDETDMKNIKPLPNLDNKIMCGNSLIEEFEGVKLFNENLILRIDTKKEKQTTLSKKSSEYQLDVLQKLQKEFFNEESRDKKNRLREEIDKIEWEFIETTLKEQKNDEAIKKLNEYKSNKSKPFFLWKLYFSDVFNRKNPGFDICIANPPYDVLNESGENISQKEFINTIRLNEGFSYSKGGKLNLYRLFIEKGEHLIREGASLTYIVPSTLLADKSTAGIRKLIKEKNRALYFIEFPEKTKVFENVTQATVIFSFKKEISKDNFSLSINLQSKELPPKENIQTNWEEIEQISGTDLTIPLANDLEEYRLLKKIHKNKLLLKDIAEFKQGDINLTFHAKYLSNTKTEYLLVRGIHIQRYLLDLDIKNDDRRWFNLNLMEKEQGENKIKMIKDNLLKERIVCQQIANMGLKKRLIFSLIPKKIIIGNSANFINLKNDDLDIRALLGILNSSLLNWRFKKTSTNNHVNVYELEQLPFIYPSNDISKEMIILVNKILSITDDEDYLKNPEKQAMVKALEKKIDKMVYELYGLTPEEIKVVEGFEK